VSGPVFGGRFEPAIRARSRDFKNVQEDIRILEKHGLVRIAKQPRGKWKVKVPLVPFEEIAVKIAI